MHGEMPARNPATAPMKMRLIMVPLVDRCGGLARQVFVTRIRPAWSHNGRVQLLPGLPAGTARATNSSQRESLPVGPTAAQAAPAAGAAPSSRAAIGGDAVATVIYLSFAASRVELAVNGKCGSHCARAGPAVARAFARANALSLSGRAG
jgi:hypothetical protein